MTGWEGVTKNATWLSVTGAKEKEPGDGFRRASVMHVVQAGEDDDEEIGVLGKWQWFGAFVVEALESGSQAGSV
jgi:hypothetical protein